MKTDQLCCQNYLFDQFFIKCNFTNSTTDVQDASLRLSVALDFLIFFLENKFNTMSYSYMIGLKSKKSLFFFSFFFFKQVNFSTIYRLKSVSTFIPLNSTQATNTFTDSLFTDVMWRQFFFRNFCLILFIHSSKGNHSTKNVWRRNGLTLPF